MVIKFVFFRQSFRIMNCDNVQKQPFQDKYTCQKCQKIYHNYTSFNKHQCNICNKCHKIFSSSQRLRSHMNFCLQDNTCNVCKRVFCSPNTLKNHVCTFCQTCNRQFASGQRFRSHKCNFKPEMLKKINYNLIKHDSKTVSYFLGQKSLLWAFLNCYWFSLF